MTSCLPDKIHSLTSINVRKAECDVFIPRDRKVETQDIVLLLEEFCTNVCSLSINTYCELSVLPFFPCHMVSHCWEKTRKQICPKPILFELPELFFLRQSYYLVSHLEFKSFWLLLPKYWNHMCAPHTQPTYTIIFA